jgi:integrase
MNRQKTDYPGVYFRMARRLGGPGQEKVFYIVFKEDGKVIEEKVGRQYRDGMTPAKASLVRADRIEGRKPSPKQVRCEKKKKVWTFNALWGEYKKSKTVYKGKKPDENRFINYIKPAIGNKAPKDVVPLDLDRMRLNRMRGKSPQTVKLTLALVRRLANFGERKGFCKALPFKVELPVVNNIVIEDLTPEQLKGLLDAIAKDTHPHAGAMMKLALFAGMRRGELFKLKWPDVDFQRAFITLKDPKGGPDQRIPLNDGAREVLDAIPRTDSEFVFPGRDGKQRVEIHKATAAIRSAAGLPKTFRPLHGLRHVFASMLASSGKVDLYQLQKLLTHKDPRMTQRYAHLTDESLKKASCVASEIVEAASKREEG